ncbi:MAG: histidine--tRNA ligase [Deltaproteobacteria bacterium]|nr:histidine--tRNA ligase [Candidatus Zymogenaceae bacterium]
MDIIKPRIMKGTRDFLPDDMRVREHVIGIIKKRFETYGFSPLATPAMEYYDILTGKYGDEGEGLIFDLAYKGGKEVALKYDLTVPMCRVIAQYQDKIVMPFKRYQIQPVWRAEKPQRGRLREFFQCDADIVGVKDTAADTEIICLITDVMGDLGFEGSVTLVNHRKLLAGVMESIGIGEDRAAAAMRVLDKLDKVGEEAVRAEFSEAGFAAGAVDKLFSLTETTGNAAKDLSRMGRELSGGGLAAEAIGDLTKIFRLLAEAGIEPSRVSFAPRLARGLAYYTGPVFETVVTTPRIGSLAGGGRYDGVIGLFTGIDVPATGMALGLERIIEVVNDRGMFADAAAAEMVLVIAFGDAEMGQAMKIAHELRRSGVNTDVYTDGGKLKKKFSYADRTGAAKVVIVAPDELSRGVVKIKDMKTGQEKEVEVSRVRDSLGRP